MHSNSIKPTFYDTSIHHILNIFRSLCSLFFLLFSLYFMAVGNANHVSATILTTRVVCKLWNLTMDFAENFLLYKNLDKNCIEKFSEYFYVFLNISNMGFF